MGNLVGKVFVNRYRIIEPLGRGGMAEVYKAWDEKRATYLALKVLRQDLAQDMIFLRRFQREAQTLENLQHPNIVRFYGIETDDLFVFMLMDFIEGTTLQTEIFQSRGKPMDEGFIGHIMGSVCSALHYAHLERLVHCDIKPANIMIDQYDQVLVTDFGIARMSDAATSTMVGFGTPAYMAPELVIGRDPTPQSDIYSLGVVLFEMLTGGERPFTGERAKTTGMTSEKVRWEQINLLPPSPRAYNPAITQETEAVISKCLEKEPAKRYTSTLELQNSLKQLLEQKYVRKKAPPKRSDPNPRVDRTPLNPKPNLGRINQVPKWLFFGFGIILIGVIFGFGRNLLVPNIQAHEQQAMLLPRATATTLVSTDPPIAEPTAAEIPTQTFTPLPLPTMTMTPTITATVYKTPTPKKHYPLPDCGSSHLHVNDSAFVSYEGGHNSLRSEPETRGKDNIIAEAHPGEVVQIIDGPVCYLGWIFWEVVTTRNERGWTPETNGKEFWIFPLTTRNICHTSLPTRLVAGKKAKVLEEPPLANLLRDKPTKSGEVVGRIQPGGWMMVLEGPECSNNAHWWKVQSLTSGDIGWTMEGDLASYYLAPEP